MIVLIAGFALDERFDTVNLVLEQETPGQLRRFAAEVIPLARATASREPAR